MPDRNDYAREWKRKNRDKVKEYKKKYYSKLEAREKRNAWAREYRKRTYNRSDFSKKYGLSREEYDNMLIAQGGECAVCGSKDNNLCVDHCHTSGIVRGLVCHPCNLALGRIETVGVENYSRYISTWPSG